MPRPDTSRHHRILSALLAVTVPMLGVALLAPAAGAKTSKPPPYVGPASGTVTCDAPNIKVTFVPPLTLADLGPSTVTIKGTLKSCTTTNPADVITLGKISGTFTTTGGCVGLATGTMSTVNFTIQWKGKHGGAKTTYTDTTGTVTGAGPAADASGNIGFFLPNPSDPTGTVNGSFPFAGIFPEESAAYGTQDQSTIISLCAPRTTPKGKEKPPKGFKKMNIKSGEIVIP